MDEIIKLTTELVEQTRDYTDAKVNAVFPDLHSVCPACENKIFKQTDGIFDCLNPECKFRLNKHIASHELTAEEADALLTTKKIGPIVDFKNRFGQPFEAEIALVEDKKKGWTPTFVFEGDDRREEELKNLSDEMIICEAPILDDSETMIKIYENEKAFLAPDMAKKADERGVRISKTILKKEIPTDQAIKLFVEGKTDLMPGFLSKKGRKFAAHLTLDRVKGKLGFEFAPRKNAKKDEEGEGDEKTAKKKTAKKKAAKKTTKKKAAKKKTTTKKPAKKKAAKKKAEKKKVAKKNDAAESPENQQVAEISGDGKTSVKAMEPKSND